MAHQLINFKIEVSMFDSDFEKAMWLLSAIVAVLGWGVIESLIWLFSFVTITLG